MTLAYEIVATIRGVLMAPYRPRVNCVLGFGANAPLDSTALVQWSVGD